MFAAPLHTSMAPSATWPAPVAQIARFGSHEHLFHEGDVATALFVIEAGVIAIYRTTFDGGRLIHGLRFKGELIGVGYGRTYGVSAVALRPSTVRRIPRSAIESALDDDPAFARRLLEICTRELMAISDQLLVIGSRTSLGRVAACLLDLSERAASGSDTFILPVTRSEMGDLLGLTIETVSRTMTRLKTLGVIALPHSDTVVIKNRETLRHLARDEGEGAARGRICA